LNPVKNRGLRPGGERAILAENKRRTSVVTAWQCRTCNPIRARTVYGRHACGRWAAVDGAIRRRLTRVPETGSRHRSRRQAIPGLRPSPRSHRRSRNQAILGLRPSPRSHRRSRNQAIPGLRPSPRSHRRSRNQAILGLRPSPRSHRRSRNQAIPGLRPSPRSHRR
jgi:hypothetical protein